MSNYQQERQTGAAEATQILFGGELFDESTFYGFIDKIAPTMLELVSHKLKEGCPEDEAFEAAKALVSVMVKSVKHSIAIKK